MRVSQELSSQTQSYPAGEPQEDEEQVGYGPLFGNRQFMTLWIAQIFSQFADRAVFVLFVAVLTTAKASSHRLAHTGAAEMTSFLYVAFTIPAIILCPVAGVYVDRWSHRTTMVISNVLRGACVALVALPNVSHSVALVLGLAFLSSVSTQFFGPAESSSIPRLVKRNELYAANSLFFTTMMIALGFGFAIGEPIISKVGVSQAPWAIACFFFVAAVLLLFIRDNVRQKIDQREPWWEELRFGLAYISGNGVVFRAILKITFLFSTIITLNIIAVGLTQQVLHALPFQFGWIVAAAGLGMGVGNFFVGNFGAKMRANILVYSGFSMLGLFMCALGSLGFIQAHLWPAINRPDLSWQGAWMIVPLSFSMMVGCSCAMVAVPTQAALQALVPEDLRGKVFGAQITAMSAASTIPAVLAGELIDNLPGGVSTTLFIIGIPTLLVGIYHLFRSRKSSNGGEIE
jgi:MFS family permease